MTSAELDAHNVAFRRLVRMRKRNSSVRYYIQFNRKGAYNPRTGKYTRSAWPILFHTREEAELAMKALPIFLNKESQGRDRRIVSCCITRTTIKQKERVK